MMNTHEAWLYLAGLWDEPKVIGGGIACIRFGMWHDAIGICRCIDELYETHRITHDHGFRQTGYMWKCTPEHAPRRAALCRVLAAKCEADHACA